MKQTILVNREDIRKVEAEEQYNFTMTVLDSLGIPLEECLPEGGFEEFTIEHKIKLRSLLDKFNVLVIDDRDGGIKIYVEEQLVAEWKKCVWNLKYDLSAIDPSKRIYVEMHTEWWTVFDGGPNE